MKLNNGAFYGYMRSNGKVDVIINEASMFEVNVAKGAQPTEKRAYEKKKDAIGSGRGAGDLKRAG